MTNFEKKLSKAILQGISRLSKDGIISDIDIAGAGLTVDLVSPKDKSHGDIATTIALKISKLVRQNPMAYAESLAAKIGEEIKRSSISESIVALEVKPPGFINFWYTDKKIFESLAHIVKERKRYGSTDLGAKEKINIEFVSANPTGPLTIAHGRQAAFGDTLANILSFANISLKREYYINDEGNQMTLLGQSIRARYLELFSQRSDMPQDGYQGSYIRDIASDIKSKYGTRFLKNDDVEFFTDYGCRWILSMIRRDLERFNVKFDVWYSQRKLSNSKRIERALEYLKRKNLIYQKGGATWFKSTDFGDDKDRVVIKSTGEYTYIAPDIAYHRDKYGRGFDRLIDIWGPDHHGYIPRIKAAVEALGHKGDTLDILIVQLCTLYRDGKAVQMSTRQGEFITLGNLIDEVGRDVARYFFLRRKRDSHLDFDIELAKKHSMDNPVYYIQYANARIHSILGYYKESKRPISSKSVHFDLLKSEEEKAMIKLLSRFPFVIELCAKNLEVFPLISYLEEVASGFHSYYDKYRVVTDDAPLTEARLFLCKAILIVIENGLELLGVEIPKSM